jgi:hypothetical protein
MASCSVIPTPGHPEAKRLGFSSLVTRKLGLGFNAFASINDVMLNIFDLAFQSVSQKNHKRSPESGKRMSFRTK